MPLFGQLEDALLENELGVACTHRDKGASPQMADGTLGWRTTEGDEAVPYSAGSLSQRQAP